MKYLGFSILLLSLAQLGIGFLIPALPTISKELVISNEQAGYLIGAFLGIYGAAQLFFAPLSDRLGRKKVALIGIVLLVTGLFIGFFSHQYNGLMCGRLLQGMGAGALSSMSKLLIRDAYPSDALARPLAILEIAAAITPSIAPWLGAEILNMLGWRWILVTNIGYATLTALLIVVFLPNYQSPKAAQTSSLLADYRAVLRCSDFYFSLLPIVSIYTSVLLYTISSAFLFQTTYGLSPRSFGQLMVIPAVSAFAGGLLATWLGNTQKGKNRLVQVGVLLFTLSGLLALNEAIWPSQMHGLFVMALAISFAAIAYGASFPVFMSEILSLKVKPGPAIALAACCQLSGSALINWMFGLVTLSSQGLMGLMFVITALILMSCWRTFLPR